jgi:PKD repeat protein
MKKLYIITSLFVSALGLQSQSQLTNNGNLKFHAGSNVTFYGNFSNNGTFKDSSQMITFKGSSLQTIGGTAVSTFNNVTLNNPVGAALSTNEKLKGILTITTGTFTTTGHTLTLLSDANGTASIGPITGNFAGDITMQRYLGTGPTDWRFLASPVIDATMADWQDDFAVSGIPNSHYAGFPFVSIYSYDETVTGSADYGYIAPTDISNKLFPGTGYWAYVGPTPVTVDVTGPPATFQRTLPVSYTSSGGPDHDGWVMLGNPYPSSIDWTSAAWTKSHINNALYIWNPQLQQYSSWVAGVGVNGGSNIIASSQAFWVQTNANNPVLECTENVKTAVDRSFIRETNQTFSFDFLKLNLNGNGYSDETFIRFDDVASNGYDTELDARKVFTTTPGVPSLSSIDQTNTDMSINSIPSVTSTISIPVKTIVGASGSYTITRDTLSSDLPDYCIVLEDLLTGIKTDLMNTPSYTFSISDTTRTARFLLHVSSSAVAVQTLATSCNGTADGLAIAAVAGNGPHDYIWTNANNDTIRTSIQSVSADTLQNMAAGTYAVTIIDAGSACGNISQSFSIDQPLALDAAFIVSNDTLVVGINDTLFTTNTTTGAIAYSWNFGDGSAVDTTQLPAPHLFSQPGTYTVSLIATHNACSDSVSSVIVVMNAPAVGLEQNSVAGGFNVFPNPSQGQFNISVPAGSGKNIAVEIYSLLGAKIYSAVLEEGTNAIDMSSHAQGIYSYRVFSASKQLYAGQLILE